MAYLIKITFEDASVIGAMDSEYTKGFWRNTMRIIAVSLVNMVNFIHRKVKQTLSAKTINPIPLIPYGNFSTLASGNPPYRSKLNIRAGDKTTHVIEMGMPTIVRRKEKAVGSLSPKHECIVSPPFKKYIGKMQENKKISFTYVSFKTTSECLKSRTLKR